MKLFSISLILCTALAAVSCTPKNNSMSHQSLAEHIQALLSSGAAIDNIESQLGQEALLNTSRPGDRLRLQAADIEADSEFPDFPPGFAADSDAVAYWERSAESEDVAIVGAFWKGGAGPGQLFYGIIGPP